MKATVYNSATGQITSTVSARSLEIIQLNIPDGSSWVEGEYSGAEYYIKDGSAVALPPKPDYPCDFDYSTEQWVWDDAQSWGNLRAERDELLAASDWTQVPDAPVDQAAWATYRQALRDLPDNTTDPRNPVWPEKPS